MEAELAERFLNKGNFSSDVAKRAKQVEIAECYYTTAMTLVNLIPKSRKLSIVLTELEGSMLWALAAAS